MENFIKEVEVDGVSHSITLGDNMIGSGLKKDENGVVSLDSLDINEEKLVKITYSELKSLRDNSQLDPGSFYRITDYVTTTTQSETKSANHPFDVIVLALNENTLCEDAKAILHEGDTYFADSDLSAWELKYCLDNDTTRFAWADETDGKGVIYRMIDEKQNDCPYDFKNILFYNTKFTDSTTNDNYYYTFSYVVNGVLYDGTTEKQAAYCYGNMMNEYRISVAPGEPGILHLNKNVFSNNAFGSNCYFNTFGNNCYNNTFGGDCYNNLFGNICSNNKFGNECSNNKFGNECSNNKFGFYCNNNNFRYNCNSNTFANGCGDNLFENYCSYNNFEANCQSNKFGNYYESNTFGESCCSNTFGGNCQFNTFGKSCCSNTFGHGLSKRSLNADKTIITLNEEYYDDGSGQLVPTKHPDLSTQPSILPYKFMGQYVYEQLIPVNKGDSIVNNKFAVETPMIISAEMFSANSFKNINISAVKPNELLLDTPSELNGYINVKYTDSSVLLSSDEYYYDLTYTSSSNIFLIDSGIMEDETLYYLYSNDTLTLSKNGEITSNSIPNKAFSKIIIDNNVTSIGEESFRGCSGLTSVVIGNSVTSIGYRAFYQCSSLTSVEIPNSVISIGDGAFSLCYGLTSVEIPNSVTSIGIDTFRDCENLTSIIIPDSVTSIGLRTFYGCSGLTSITCKAINPPSIQHDTFVDVPYSIPLYVPAESVEAYKSAYYWDNFSNIKAINE